MRKKFIKNKTLVIATFFVAALFIGTSMNAVLATNNKFESTGPYVVPGTSEYNSVASEPDDSKYEDEQAKKESRRAYEEEQNSNDDIGVTNDGSGDEGDEKPDEGGDDLSGIEAPDDPGDPIPPIPPGEDSVGISSKEKEIAVKQAIINDLESINGKLVTVKGSEMIANIESVEAEAERMVSEAVSANQLDAIYLEVSSNGGETTGIIGCLAASAIFGFPSWYCLFSAATMGTTSLSVQSVGVSPLATQTSETQTTDCPLCAGSSLSESETQALFNEVKSTLSIEEVDRRIDIIQSSYDFYNDVFVNLNSVEKSDIINNFMDNYESKYSSEKANALTSYSTALRSTSTEAKTMARASAVAGESTQMQGNPCYFGGNGDGTDIPKRSDYETWSDWFNAMGDYFADNGPGGFIMDILGAGWSWSQDFGLGDGGIWYFLGDLADCIVSGGTPCFDSGELSQSQAQAATQVQVQTQAATQVQVQSSSPASTAL
jgi:hypothetical protein